MTDTELVVVVHGTPAPKGSLAYKGHNKKTGAPVMAEQVANSKPWRDRVHSALIDNAASPEGSSRFGRLPIGAEVTFSFPRPRSHYGTGRNTDRLKPSAPTHPTGHQLGDLDKLARNIADAIQDAGLVADDSQIVELTARKTYTTPHPTPGSDILTTPGCVIRLYPIHDPTGPS